MTARRRTCLVLAAAVLATGCNRTGSTPAATTSAAAATRERAYRPNNLGVALMEQFKQDEAAVEFRRAIAIDPTLGIGHVNLSIAMLTTQDMAGAAREATDAARLLPSAPQPPYVLGLVARAENRDQDAVRFFTRVLEIDRGDTGARVNLAQLYLQDRKFEEATALLRLAVADEPFNVTAVYSLGLALIRSGSREEGQRVLEQSQTLRKTGYATTYGTQYLEQGRYAEAVASTGDEPELVDAAASPARFSPTPLGAPFPAVVLTPIDADGDGDLDVFASGPSGQRLLRNEGGGVFVDMTAQAGLGGAPASEAVGAVAGDYDNDGAADLFVLRKTQQSLYHNDGHGHFTDATARAHIPTYPAPPSSVAFSDVDHDGDLDLVIAGSSDTAPLLLLRNNGNGTFADVTRAAGLARSTGVVAIAPTDFDNRRDVDLLIVNRARATLLFKNLRDGTFHDVAADVGLAAVNGGTGAAGVAGTAPAGAPASTVGAVAVGDVNKDDYPDFFFSRTLPPGGPTGGSVFALSDGRGRFTLVPGPAAAGSARAAQFLDYDNDGLLDLLTWSADGPHLFRNVGRQWNDVTASAMGNGGGAGNAGGTAVSIESGRQLAAADLDGDGDTDLVTAGPGGLVFWRNSGDPRRTSLRVRLTGRVSNRLGVGSKIQLRAGSLRGRVETSSTSPAVAPADVVFGLGTRAAADVVRTLWPSGILQAETTMASPLIVEELDRKPSSCPFLFTWNGERFEFVTDFMGGGEMGHWETAGARNHPDPVEYVRIRGDQLRARDGRFDVRVTNELEETLFLDRVGLLAISHPEGVDVFPNEGLTDPPKPHRLFTVSHARPAMRVADEHGRDVTARVARVDRKYVDDFELAAFGGYAVEHSLTVDIGTEGSGTRVAGAAASPVLLLTGWTDYSSSSDNLAASQAGLSLHGPSLQIRDARGAWRTVVADIGMPVGRPQTIVVDLTPHLRPGEHEVRLATNMRIYWDMIAVADRIEADVTSTWIDPESAHLHARGFSAEMRPGGRGPLTYDYGRVVTDDRWKAMTGAFTREGDVRELVSGADDRFAIARPADEIALTFGAATLPALPDGWTRTFLLVADGFSKEMDVNSGGPDTVEPLPFHRMSRYPYGAGERYPDTPAYRTYRERYNTRVVSKAIPPIESGLQASPASGKTGR